MVFFWTRQGKWPYLSRLKWICRAYCRACMAFCRACMALVWQMDLKASWWPVMLFNGIRHAEPASCCYWCQGLFHSAIRHGLKQKGQVPLGSCPHACMAQILLLTLPPWLCRQRLPFGLPHKISDDLPKQHWWPLVPVPANAHEILARFGFQSKCKDVWLGGWFFFVLAHV